jgi:radical SAM protein with 4Fe4S-binding SPASM domain
MNAIRTYRKWQIPVILSCTINALNYRYFGDVVEIGRKMKVKMIWCDRYIPIKEKDDLYLTGNQAKEFFQSLGNPELLHLRRSSRAVEVAHRRALQFLIAGGKPYKCTAGKNLLAISPDGDVYPCRRMPISLGNMDYASLVDIYRGNSVLQNLRSNESLDHVCKKCFYSKSCSGGLRCLSWAVYKDFHRKDPHCWLPGLIDERNCLL